VVCRWLREFQWRFVVVAVAVGDESLPVSASVSEGNACFVLAAFRWRFFRLLRRLCSAAPSSRLSAGVAMETPTRNPDDLPPPTPFVWIPLLLLLLLPPPKTSRSRNNSKTFLGFASALVLFVFVPPTPALSLSFLLLLSFPRGRILRCRLVSSCTICRNLFLRCITVWDGISHAFPNAFRKGLRLRLLLASYCGFTGGCCC